MNAEKNDDEIKDDIEEDMEDKITNEKEMKLKKNEKIRVDISEIEWWDPATLPDNFFLLISSKRRSGKSVLVSHILKPVHKRFERAYLFSETAHLQDDLYMFIPKNNRYQNFRPDIIQNIIDKQLQIKNSINKSDKKNKVPSILLLLDDVIGDPAVRTSNVLKDLATKGRHGLNISVILLSQTISAKNGFPSVVRQNCDVMITFAAFDKFNRDTIVEGYGSIVDKTEGIKLLNSITCSEPYMTCVFEVWRNNLHEYKDYVKKYKAPSPTPPKFKIGNQDEAFNVSLKRDNVMLCSPSVFMEVSGGRELNLNL